MSQATVVQHATIGDHRTLNTGKVRRSSLIGFFNKEKMIPFLRESLISSIAFREQRNRKYTYHHGHGVTKIMCNMNSYLMKIIMDIIRNQFHGRTR
jgi:hypothetical protein